MKKGLVLLAVSSAAILVAALPGAAQAQRPWAKHDLGFPDYERTASSGEETVLAHTKSPGLHTVDMAFLPCSETFLAHAAVGQSLVPYKGQDLPSDGPSLDIFGEE